MTKEQRFTKLFKFLFEEPTFKDLPTKAKLLYSLLTERQNLSKSNAKQYGIQSQFIDDEGRLFSIYSNSEIMKKINMSEPTVIKLKKQLITFGLLEEVRLGNNQPNRLYPKKPYDEYFYAHDIDEFYRLPHSLFENPKYKSLKSESIIAYAIYLSRYEYSIYKQHFADSNNDIFCYFSNENMANFLGVSTRKIERIKNELVASGLMINKRAAFGKANKLYINLPEASHSKELKNCRHRNLKNVGTGTKKLSAWELKKCRTSYIYFSNIYNSDIDSSDMYDMNDNKNEIIDNNNQEPNYTNHSNHKSQTTNNFNESQAEQEMLLQALPKQLQQNLKHFSNSEIRCIKSVLNKAKTNYNNYVSVNERITYELCAYEIGEALRRIKLFSHKKNEAITNLEAYMMQTFKRVFIDYIRNQQSELAEFEANEMKSIAEFQPQNDMQKMAKMMFINHF